MPQENLIELRWPYSGSFGTLVHLGTNLFMYIVNIKNACVCVCVGPRAPLI